MAARSQGFISLVRHKLSCERVVHRVVVKRGKNVVTCFKWCLFTSQSWCKWESYVCAKCFMGPFIYYVRTEGGRGSSAMRTPMYCCHSDVIICAYRVGGWVWNLRICAYVINEWPLCEIRLPSILLRSKFLRSSRSKDFVLVQLFKLLFVIDTYCVVLSFRQLMVSRSCLILLLYYVLKTMSLTRYMQSPCSWPTIL